MRADTRLVLRLAVTLCEATGAGFHDEEQDAAVPAAIHGRDVSFPVLDRVGSTTLRALTGCGRMGYFSRQAPSI